ncbi:hypothetical protein ACIBG7_20070 [Nonomuraea sp. NPDC050328]
MSCFVAPYLEGPDGLHVEPIQLEPGSPHLLFARMREPRANPGEIWYRVTRRGLAVGFPGYYQLHELEEIVDLSHLRGPDERTQRGTA